MGCCLRKAGPVRITVTEAPDYPIRIRLRLRGDLTEATTEKIAAKLCQITTESATRFNVEIAEKADFYFATVNVIDGESAGATRRIANKIISQVAGRGVAITDNLKLIGAKEHVLAGEL
ncbi:uncharacterized protein [Apostichopus japonicus]|uniref:uncharacterized protein n=1 Tax=Stichopus japonicus TaxID=307972 RepID=UPI003AB3558E